MKDLGVVFDSELSFAFPVRHFPVLQIPVMQIKLSRHDFGNASAITAAKNDRGSDCGNDSENGHAHSRSH